MPRKARLVVPGAVYHVMARCIEQYTLFSDDADREHFLVLLDACLKRTNTRCYAWVLMNSHYHLVLRIGDIELWEVMKPLNMRYAQYHKAKTGRNGPLFMDRYKSIVTQDQNYVQELVRYVHLNPIRAGICKNPSALERYPWCGHSVVMGRSKRRFQDVRTVLRRFGSTEKTARSSYCRFLRDGLKEKADEDVLIDLVRKSNAGSESGRTAACWVIGEQKFVREVLSSAEARRLRISRFTLEGGTFNGIAENICAVFTISAAMLRRRQRDNVASEARKVFAYIAVKVYNAPLGRVGEYLGVGNAAVSAMVHTGREIVQARKIVI
jgi:putative transposase